MTNQQTLFKPKTGLEKNILSTQPEAGSVYFTKDTKKIFFDYDNEEHLLMGGGGVALFYGTQEQVEQNVFGKYPILFDSIDKNESEEPKEEDLIFNADGGFYRIKEIDYGVRTYYCDMIAVSGTSGGPGPGGPSTPGQGGSNGITMSAPIGLSSYSSWIYQQPRNIVTQVTSPKDSGIAITYTVRNLSKTNVSTTKTYGPYPLQGSSVTHTFDLGSVLQEGTNSIIIYAAGDEGGSTSRTYLGLNTVIMRLESSKNFTNLQVFNSDIGFICRPVGEGLNKTLKIYIDNQLQNNLTKKNINTSGADVSISIPALSHGTHTLKAVLFNDIETVQSSLEYEIACAEALYTDPIIWLASDTPTEILNYTTLKVPYMVYNPADPMRAVVGRTLNGVQLPEVNVSYSVTEWLNWIVSNYKVGNNSLELICGKTSRTFAVKVQEDNSRNLDIIRTNLAYNFDATGRSNLENIVSRETWVSNGSSAKFNNFNWYNNGWLTENDDTFLRISNGASLQIPLTGIMKETNLSQSSKSYTFDFVFRLRNIKTYSLLIDTVVDYTDETQEEVKAVHKSLTDAAKRGEGVAISYYNNGVGFGLGTQEAFFSTKDDAISGRYKEDELMHITFVFEAPTINGTNPLYYMYINGIMSAAKSYNKETDSLSTGTLNTLTINSDYCDVDLYKMRIYTSNLTSKDVLQNMISDYHDVNMYDINMSIIKYDEGIPTIDYEEMLAYNVSHPSKPLMPYIVFESPAGILPYVKDEIGDGTPNFGFSFTNTYLDYAWENKIIEGYFDERSDYYNTVEGTQARSEYRTPEEYYLHHAPSYTCAPHKKGYLNVQGTSSQGYPRRNYKGKLKGPGEDGLWTFKGGPHDGKKILSDKDENGNTFAWYMDSNIGESTFCWKADYMESSRTHNTGFASFVNTLYSKHPLDDYGVASNGNKTAIYGFPVFAFHKYGDKYSFIGLYNYNLDKACKDTFGFTSKSASKVKVHAKATADSAPSAAKVYYTLKNGILSAKSGLAGDSGKGFTEGTVYYEISANPEDSLYSLDMASTAECWQIEHNQGGKCSFKNADFSIVSDDPSKAGIIAAAAEDFEIRYHANKDEIEEAIAGTKSFSNGYSVTARNAYLRKQMANLEVLVAWVNSTDPDQATNEALTEPYVLEDGTTFNIDNEEYRLAKFSAEFKDHLDLEYCCVYFIMTELLLCYDSRGKNCMLATWGPKTSTGNYIWYPIFYDIDTQLGINNSGVPYWDYYEEATENKTFSTSNSVLWNNLWKTKKSDILDRYEELRNGSGNKLSYQNLNGYYEFDASVSKSPAMRGERPEIAVNVDEYYKYLDPAIGHGYVNTSGEDGNHTNRFFYCLQGTRKLQRELFLRNRFNYIDSKWQKGDYSTTGAKNNSIQMRYYANDNIDTSDKYLAHVPTTEEAAAGFEYAINHPLDANGDFEVTPYLKQYIHAQQDDTHLPNVYANDNETVSIGAYASAAVRDSIANTPRLSEQLAYFGNSQYISSLGDLSRHYLGELVITYAKRLKDLIVGNDHKDYKNLKLNTNSNFALDDSAFIEIAGKKVVNSNAKTLLEKVVFSNLSALGGTIDLSGSEKLREFRGLNTQITALILADGVQIETLHLPETISSLLLTEPTSLTSVISDASAYEVPVVEYKPVNLTEDTFVANTYYYYENKDAEPILADSFLNTKIYYEKQTYNKTCFPSGLYIEGITNKNITSIGASDVTALNKIDIVGGNMGYGSYDIASKVLKIKEMMKGNEKLDASYSLTYILNLEKVNWSPYRQVASGEPVIPGASYVKSTIHYTFEPYTPDGDWSKNTLNGKVYQVDNTIDTSILHDTSFFDSLIAAYESGEQLVFGTSGEDKIPYLSGLVYIDNDASNPVEESKIKNEYIDMYWPNLSIYVANVIPSYIARFIFESNSGLEEELYIQKFDSTISGQTPKNENDGLNLGIPVQAHFDFAGWKDQNGKMVPQQMDSFGNPVFDDDNRPVYDFSNYIFSAANKEYIFTAVFVQHQQTITYKAGLSENAMQVVTTDKVTYGEQIHAPNVVPVLDETSIEATNPANRYKLLGWTTNSSKTLFNSLNEAEQYLVVFDENLKATGDFEYYAALMVESAKDNPSDLSYFQFVENNDKAYDEYKNLGIDKTYTIKVAPQTTLSGKITIPTEYNGGYVTQVNGSGFENQTQIKRIYWYGAHHLRIINDRAFAGCRGMISFEYPTTLRTIGASAFQSCGQLEFPEYDQCLELQSIGTNAYNGACGGDPQEVERLFFPGSVQTINAGAFSFNHPAGTIIDLMQFGDSEHASQLKVYGTPNNVNSSNFVIAQNGSSNTGVKNLSFFYGGETLDQDVLNKILTQTLWYNHNSDIGDELGTPGNYGVDDLDTGWPEQFNAIVSRVN